MNSTEMENQEKNINNGFPDITPDNGPDAEPTEKYKWQKFSDPASNRSYYVNIETNETTLNPPPGVMEKLETKGNSGNPNTFASSKRLKMDEDKSQSLDEEAQTESGPISEQALRTSEENGHDGEHLEQNGHEFRSNENPQDGSQDMYSHHMKYTQGYVDVNHPSNWRTAIDHDTGRQYHYNIITRQTQWTSPNEIASQMPSSGDYAFQNQLSGRRRRRSMKEMQDAWDRGDRVGLWECPDCSKILTEGSKKTHPDSCNARKARSVHMVQGTPSDILAGAHWRAVQDRSGQTYYYHQITKQTSWYKPHEMQNFEQYQQNQAIMQNSLGSGSSNFNQWTEVTDSSGRTYYYNNLTGATSWNKPAEYSELHNMSSAPESHAAAEYGSTMPGSSLSSAEATLSADVGEWIEVVDSSSGNKYYYNSVTKATSWTNPMALFNSKTKIKEEAESNDEDQHAVRDREPTPTEEALNFESLDMLDGPYSKNQPKSLRESRTQSDDNKMTYGENETAWREAVDKSSGRKYYYNVFTNETNWELPSELISATSSRPKESEMEENGDWKAVVDDKTGKTYYFNVHTKETSWSLPSEAETKAQEEHPSSEPSWIKIYDDKNERFYYHNPATDETTWDIPEGFVETSENVITMKNTEAYEEDYDADAVEDAGVGRVAGESARGDEDERGDDSEAAQAYKDMEADDLSDNEGGMK